MLVSLSLAMLLAGDSGLPPQAGDDARALELKLAELRGQRPETARVLGEEARLLHALAELAEGEQRVALHAEGLRTAERALALDPDEPSALLWWSAHLGSQATATKPLAAIRIASSIEKALLRLREIDPSYDHAAADRVLGHLYALAPPVISVGSMKKAEQHLREALARDPRFPGNQLFWAELLEKKGQCATAHRSALLVLSSPELGRYPLEAAAWRRQAGALVERTTHCR